MTACLEEGRVQARAAPDVRGRPGQHPSRHLGAQPGDRYVLPVGERVLNAVPAVALGIDVLADDLREPRLCRWPEECVDVPVPRST